MKLSIVIPGYKDRYHECTVADILEKSSLEPRNLEIVSVFDGFKPTWSLVKDLRRKIVYLDKNRGMREAINAGVQASQGEFVMRLDEHCCFDHGFDKVLTDACCSNEIMTAIQYQLDPESWRILNDPPLKHAKLKIAKYGQSGRKFSAVPWRSRDRENEHLPVSETMAMQGSMWIMPRAWWDQNIGFLQTEGYGPLVQDSVEVSMKTWQANGRLMLNQSTWYAHKHRRYNRTHNNGTASNPAKPDEGFAYALAQWETYYNESIKPKWGM